MSQPSQPGSNPRERESIPFPDLGVRILAAIAIVIGTFWLTAWIVGAAPRWGANHITVKTNMAIAQIAGGIALLLLAPLTARPVRRVAGAAAALLVFVIGALTTFEHIAGADLGIDQILFTEPPGSVATASPNRPGPPGSFSLTLLGAGLLALAFGQRRVIPLFGLATGLIQLVPAIGYLYGISEFHDRPRLTGIAWPTVVALVCLGTGLIFTERRAGPVALLLRNDPGGILLRRLFPPLIVLGPLIGFVVMIGQRRGWYGNNIEAGLVVILLLVVFSIFLWTSAARLSRAAAAHARADQALRAAEEWKRMALSVARLGVWRHDIASSQIHLDPLAREHYGLQSEIIRLPDILNRIHPDDRDAQAAAMDAALDPDRNGPVSMEYRVRLENGGIRWLSIRGRVDFRRDGGKVSPVQGVGTTQDITARKEAERALRLAHDSFRHLVQNSPFGVYAVDADFRLVEVSLGAQKVFQNVRPLHGRDFAEVLRIVWSEPFASEAIALFRHTLATGEPYHAPSTVEQRHDIPATESYDWKIERVTLPDGRFGVVCHFYDLSERQRLEAALRESEERFRIMADGTPLLIWATDPEGKIRFVNQAYLEFFGVKSEDLLAGGWLPLVHPDDAAGYAKAFGECLKDRKPFRAQCRVRRHDGAWRWIESHGQPLFSQPGEFLGIAGSSPDVTAQKEFQAELERIVAERTTRLQELVSEMEHFSYTITHDMRAPLRALRGFSEVLDEKLAGSTDPELQLCLNRIATSAERMDLLITDALSYSKAVRQDLPLAPVNVARLLQGMLDTYPEFLAQRKHIRIDGPLPIVLGNEAGLTQCFSNLLGNGLKFVDPGATPAIRVYAESVGSDGELSPNQFDTTFQTARRLPLSEQDSSQGWVRICVEDQGIGISKNMLPRVFNMFSRGSNESAGTGIGLALVRKVVHRMGGRVGVESELGKGSRFWIELRTANPPIP